MFENFTTFNFNEGVPYVTVTKNGVAFNKGVIMKLNYPTHVLLLINAVNKQIAIKACSSDNPNAIAFYNDEKKSNALTVRWNARDLLNTIKEITGWDYSKEGYKAAGTLISEEQAMLFDLNNPEILN
jgi:hypothetical protein